MACDEGEVDLKEERCVRTAETSLREGIYTEETSRVLWSRVDVDGGGDVSGGSVRTAEASLREVDSEETRRVLRSYCSAQRTLGRIGEGNEELDRGKAEQQKLARCSSSSGCTRNTRKWEDNLEVEREESKAPLKNIVIRPVGS